MSRGSKTDPTSAQYAHMLAAARGNLNHRHAALLITLGLAMKAKLGELDPDAMTLASEAVSASFSPDDPMRTALNDFSNEFVSIAHDPNSLSDLGETLWRAVIRACWPSQCDRADLEG